MTKTESIIGDIYDAWRAQDLDRLASYLPDDFSHMIYIPKEVLLSAGFAAVKKRRSSGWGGSPCSSIFCGSIPAT